ncbi:MAG TPA: 6-hydroxymethylpterin diphosphokinase MptE-like protein [Candidatus Thermoplasmatota archaeon]|nr:6-hydroxymethylpterin diphosphokinase MptE-like protein [Candidatus Thermoplasmatota archaeon]
MRWEDWAPHYRSICAEFGYDAQADRAAAHDLHAHVLATSRFRDLGVELRNRRNLAVVGAGPSLHRTDPRALAGRVVVACDGATTWLREVGVTPHVVVTDLDGDPGDLAWAAAQGSAMVVHAHGDNRPALAGLAPRLGPRLFGTYQCAPEPALEPMQNVGGFTDGDRAVLLCEALGAKECLLFGFDFDAPPSAYSHRWDPRTKPAKLAWARRLVEAASARGLLRIVRHMP